MKQGFQHGLGLGVESGVYTCKCCGKRTRETGECESGVGLCVTCYNEAGLENEHQDGYHDVPNANCPMCRGAA